MIQVLQERLTFEEFLEIYPDDGGRYELIEGSVVEMRPIGPHELMTSFIGAEFNIEIRRLGFPYTVAHNTLVKLIQIDSVDSSYLPDVIVLDRSVLAQDPYWEKHSTISEGASARLVVEVVSTNWRDDYLTKLRDYEALGISEYWIVDYLALGAVRYIGQPKQPTISVYELIDGEYQVRQFQGNDRIVSSIFPELNLRVSQVFEAV